MLGATRIRKISEDLDVFAGISLGMEPHLFGDHSVAIDTSQCLCS